LDTQIDWSSLILSSSCETSIWMTRSSISERVSLFVDVEECDSSVFDKSLDVDSSLEVDNSQDEALDCPNDMGVSLLMGVRDDSSSKSSSELSLESMSSIIYWAWSVLHSSTA
jgi:hypothetical protein